MVDLESHPARSPWVRQVTHHPLDRLLATARDTHAGVVTARGSDANDRTISFVSVLASSDPPTACMLSADGEIIWAFEESDEQYLMKSPETWRRLSDAIDDVEAGKIEHHDLVEDA